MNNQANLSGVNQIVKKALYVLFGILIYRIGAHVPVPGIDPAKLAQLFSQQSNTIFGLFNMFSGGALRRFSIFALGIMPYISASIVIQLVSAVHPRLEELKKEGESGKRKLNQYTRVLTLFIAAFQAFGMAKYLVYAGTVFHSSYAFYLTAVVTLVTGTMFLMWLGEQMTERGIGNGISIIIFAGIVTNLPSAASRTIEQIRDGQLLPISALILLVMVLGITALVVFIERGQRKIPINYAKRQQGKAIYASQSSHLPLKINMAGVIPPIFASSILLFPATLSQWFGHGNHMQWLGKLGMMLSPGQPLYTICMALAIIFFCFYYTALVFNPNETADNLRKSGAMIPGIRPGQQTANYIDKVMTKLTVIGAIYLTAVSLMPEFFIVAWNVPFTFGGTSLLIIVVVVMDFWAQVQAHMMSYQYASLMKKTSIKKRF